MSDLEDLTAVETDSLFAEAIKEHLALKARNAGLDGDMPLDPYIDGDPMENHPLFKSEEQARIEETLDGEPAEQLSSTRLPWPGEERRGSGGRGAGRGLDRAAGTSAGRLTAAGAVYRRSGRSLDATIAFVATRSSRFAWVRTCRKARTSSSCASSSTPRSPAP
jgi:hypothetical protein